MFRPRVIPCLLLRNLGLVKSIKFKDYRYIGDPMNAVKIFNDKKADELIFLDIEATNKNQSINIDLVEKIGEECNMPFTVGGGIRTTFEIRNILKSGAEKVCINSEAVENPSFIKEAAELFGSSTIVVSIDVKKKIFAKQEVYIRGGSKSTSIDPVKFSILAAEMGAGEIVINSIDKDGTMEGYDLELIKKISNAVDIPVIALGGAGNLNDLKLAVEIGKASAVAAGSLFVFHGPRKAVLINFPTKQELQSIFNYSISK